ncbi:MAG: tyrosine-type recombinase/integrase [Desulfobacterales bacterium]
MYQYEQDIKVNGKPEITFYITYKDGSRKIWEKVGTKSEGITPQIADDIRKERTLKARHGEEVLTAKQIKKRKLKANMPLDDIADAYFEQRGGSAQAGQFDRYRYDKHVKPIIGQRPVSSLTELDMRRIEKAMVGKAAATIWGALELVRRIANYGKRAKLCGGLTFTIKLPKRDNQVVEYLSPDQAGRLLAVLDEWSHQDVARMLKTAMFSGMRRGEIFKLQDGDIDFAASLITLRKPKGGRTVSIPLNPIVAQVFKDQLAWKAAHKNEAIRSSQYLFPGRYGGKRVDSTAVERIHKKAKLPKGFRIFHGLRHHFAVTLANSGEFDLNMIGELLTHKSPEMTRRYAQYLPDSLKKAGNRAAELLNGHASNGTDDEKKSEVAG